MNMQSVIEFYDGQKIVGQVYSTMVPTVDSFISIKGKTWRVVRVTYALDHRQMRANVDLREHLRD